MARSRRPGREWVPGWRDRFPLLLYGPLARFLGVTAIGLAPLILGYVGLHEYLSRLPSTAPYGRGWRDILFYDLQLPILSSAPVQGPGPYPVLLGIARLLAPAVAGLATLGTLRLLLAEQWHRWSAATAGRHAIVAGDGPVALEIARRLRAERRKVVLVSASGDTLAQARRSDLLEIRGDAADPQTLRAAGITRAAELYACAAEGTVNATITLRARDALSSASKRPLVAYALVRDMELNVALRARRIGAPGDSRLRLDFFDIEAIAARKLLDEHPLPVGEDGQVRVVIVGFAQLGQAILREVARRHPPLRGRRPVEAVIMRASEAEVTAVIDAFPAIGDSCSLGYGTKPVALPQAGVYTAFVCIDGTDDALREGLAIAHSLAGSGGHVVICLPQASPFAGVIAARSGLIDDVMGTLSVFGVLQEGCVPADIRADFTEQLARAIHRAYMTMETAKGNTAATNPSLVPWERLPEHLRQANISQAADIGAKMATIGAVVIPLSAAAPTFTFRDQEIERLARIEHDRWMRERAASGWKYGQQRDNARKLHPDLVDWAHLSDEAKGKDRNAVRTLPMTLHDAGFQILRLPEHA